MSEKIVVPKGMRKAAVMALCKMWGYDATINAAAAMSGNDYILDTSLEAALQWLADNPIMPTDEEAFEVAKAADSASTPKFVQTLVAAWQARMFLTTTPTEEEISDDLLRETFAVWNKRVSFSFSTSWFGLDECDKKRWKETVRTVLRLAQKAGSK